MMAPTHARSRGRMLLLAALVAAWAAVLVAVWWRGPAPAQPAPPAHDAQPAPPPGSRPESAAIRAVPAPGAAATQPGTPGTGR